MPPWQLEEFTRERVERARLLLAEPGEQQGSADLQRYVKSMDWVVALHRTFISEDGEARRGVSERERLQLESLAMAYIMDPPSSQALVSESPNSPLFKAGHASVEQLAQHWACSEGAAQELEQWQRAAGLDPLLTAAGAQRLALLPGEFAACRVIAAGSSSPELARSMAVAAEQASACLAALQPGNACYLWKHASALGRLERFAEAAAAYRRALAATEGSKDYFVPLRTASLLIDLLMGGAESPRWDLGEVRRLLGLVQRMLPLCKPWLPRQAYDVEKSDLAKLEGHLKRLAAQHPGQMRLPAQEDVQHGSAVLAMQAVVPACAACGKEVLSLRACSACRSVSYCSRECQMRHWRAPGSGYKAECSTLAAAQRGGAGSGS
ncbi:hypothetical protein ABPG75_003323 [Micractinium tetrahymenae]